MVQTAPKIYEIVNWLLSPDMVIPERFLMHKTKLVSLVPYITEQLWVKPQLTKYLNKHLNDLYNIPDPIDTLVLLKKIFRNQGISKMDLYQIPFYFKPKLIEAIELKEGYDQNNAISKAMLMGRLNIPNTLYIKYAATKANVKSNSSSEIKQQITEVLEIEKKKDHHPVVDKDRGVYLKELNQDVIDSEELVLFDISLLKKSNKVLFIFIDKNNHKKYFLKSFQASIYVSKEDCVINNDYIETITPDKFIGYKINDIKIYNKLKYMLNYSYKRIINGTYN